MTNALAKVLSQLTRKQHVPLTAAQWAELLPDHLNDNPLDRLMFFVCDLPGVLGDATKLLTTVEAHKERETAIVSFLWRVFTDISQWQAELHTLSSTFLFVAVPSKLINPSDSSYKTKLFPFALEFRSLQVSSCFVASWAIQLQILIMLLRLSQEIGIADEVPAQYSNLVEDFSGLHNEAEKLFRNLCQSVEFCHRVEMGTFGPQTMLYSKFIMHCFATRFGSERELHWFQNISNMYGSQTRCAIKLMAFQGDET